MVKILIVHPLMSAMGGGERLCCESMIALNKRGHDLTLLSGEFAPGKIERFFGFEGLFNNIQLRTYSTPRADRFGTYNHLLHHLKMQKKVIPSSWTYDLVFSTQDVGYIPDYSTPVLQWGYFPNSFPRGIYGWPLRFHYSLKIKRIGLILAISEYSKSNFDRSWKVPTTLVYPACNMIRPEASRENIVVTAARGVPEKNLELFWETAKKVPGLEFVLLLTVDPRFVDYSKSIRRACPPNGRVIVNPAKELYHSVLAKSLIYLHLMRGEHFGITVVESMSAGCVPVVHASGGPQEIVDDSGLLWHEPDEIPRLLDLADNSYDSLSKLSKERARFFSGEKFDKTFGELLEGISSRLP